MNRFTFGIAFGCLVGLLPFYFVFERDAEAGRYCTDCHYVHNAVGPTLMGTAATGDNACLSCHNPSGPGTVVEPHVTTSNGFSCFRFTCTDCHRSNGHYATNVRGNEQILNLRTEIKVPHSCGQVCDTHPLVYECRGNGAPDRTCPAGDDTGSLANGSSTFIANGFAQYWNPCEVCHSRTASTKHGYHPAGHQAGNWCQQCHAHSAGFDKAGSPGTPRNTYFEDTCDISVGGPCGPYDHGYCEAPVGAITCEDGDTGIGCASGWTEPCTPSGTEDNAGACADSLDNDCDGAIDCDDPDCATFCAGAGENGAVECSDGTDNDGDGQIDCHDIDCWGPPDYCSGTAAECCRSGGTKFACYLGNCDAQTCNRGPACDVY